MRPRTVSTVDLYVDICCATLVNEKMGLPIDKLIIATNRNDVLQELRYSMVHRGDKGTKENIKTELLISNYDVDDLQTATVI